MYARLTLKKILNFLLDCLFPIYCSNCRKFGKYLCNHCYEELHFLCLPVPLKLETCFLDEVWAVFSHDRPITSLLYQLKYQSVKGIGNYLGNLIYYSFNLPAVDAIVSVPLHPKKKRNRGFNQAEVIAKQLASQMKVPWIDLLIRTKDTPAQALGMNKARRITNTQKLYALNQVPATQLQKNHQKLNLTTVLLVDDVITTGSTLNACAEVLKTYQIKKVIGLAVTHRS